MNNFLTEVQAKQFLNEVEDGYKDLKRRINSVTDDRQRIALLSVLEVAKGCIGKVRMGYDARAWNTYMALEALIERDLKR
mgnify:CR=1 FL=1